MFEQGVDASLCVKPKTGKILACSQAIYNTLGYDPNSLLGRSIRELAPDNPAGEIWNALTHQFELCDSDIEVLHRDGNRVPMSASAKVVWGDGGEILCGLIILRKRIADDPSWQVQDKRLAYEISVAEVRERERIARGLHDVVGQLHTLLQMKLDELQDCHPSTEANALIAEMYTLLKQAMQSTRTATFDLSNPLLNLLGLNAAIESLGQTLGLPLYVEGGNEPLPLPEPVLAVVFRVVRELLFNVCKHALARHVSVSVNLLGGNLLIRIVDDGVGFDVGALPGLRPEGGYGLASVRAQMLSLGGRLEIDSAPGAGSRMLISLPLSAG